MAPPTPRSESNAAVARGRAFGRLRPPTRPRHSTGMRSWTARLGAASLWLLACRGDDGPTSTTDTSPPSDDDAYPQPRILDPSTPVIELKADHHAPLVFTVEGVIPGVTEVLLDDRLVGSILGESGASTLTADTWTVPVQGALVIGSHTLVLVNPGGADGEGQRSREVTVLITASTTRTWTAAVDDPVIAEGTALFVDGEGDEALLALIRDVDGVNAEAQLLRASAGAWVGPPRTLALPGYVDDPEAWIPRVAFHLRPVVDAEPLLRAAWTVDLPGAAAVAGEAPFADLGALVASTVVTTPGPIVDPVEWSALDHLRLTDGSLLLEVVARVDAELPHPGDRRLLGATWPAGAPAPIHVDAITSGGRTDLDALGPALTVAGEVGERYSVRVGDLHPGLLDLSDAGAPTLSLGVTGALMATTPGAMIGMTTITGAFRSRSVFAADPLRGPSLTLIDERGFAAATLTPPAPIEEKPTGPPSATVLDGRPIALLPYGDAAPVRVLSSDGALLRDQALDDVHCDRVAVVPAIDASTSIGFACLRGGELRLGLLGGI